MTQPHKPGCMADMRCAVFYHADGVCPGPYGKCTCDSLPNPACPMEDPSECDNPKCKDIPGCKCKEMSCPEDCKNNHTHKTFYCEKCEPVYPPVPAHEKCDCTATNEGPCQEPNLHLWGCGGDHEGPCPDPRAETWEERFDALVQECITKEKLKSFMASEIEKAVKETEERKDKEYSDFVHEMNIALDDADKAVLEERRRIAGIMSRIVKQAVDESPGGRKEVWERTINDFIRLEIAFISGKEDLPEIINPK